MGHAAGAVEEHVERADLISRSCHGTGIADVQRPAGDALQRGEAGELGFVDIGGPEPRAFAVECDGGRVADPLPRCRDQRGLAGKPPGHRSAPGEGGLALLDEGR